MPVQEQNCDRERKLKENEE
ncbi:hypothetical protein GDI1547 [Gluconacetobacter diazotrophicus PA1 5]|uniref:Uncharacterized protein n=1 Tax=Gluconacetobacter diazotrophicus (strain ATCC 49037 / DSM 5601 / CCUG 37298 / CIP 103539 / LMG 7603 / PAl5) TaxID=272568 RepID=A9HGF0_GLUDA|nr:hypothetical protein GDI1547 [Gluconacetobacter diazotrophicus PA1 5]